MLTPCDKFARGKTGLCASHSQLVQDGHEGGGLLGRPVVEMVGYSLPEGRVHGGGLMAMLQGYSGGPSESGPMVGGGEWV